MAAHVTEDKLIGRESEGFADGGGRHAFGQSRRGGSGGLGGRGFEDGLAELFNPGVVGLAVAERTAEQLVFIEQLRQERA